LSHNKFRENVKKFIYDFIDSVEQLDILLYVRKNCTRSCTAEELSKELRSSVSSINKRMEDLKTKGLIGVGEDPNSFQYFKGTDDRENVLDELAEEYKVRRHLVLEIIFSPLKKARGFADSFLLGNTDKKDGEDNG
jgi:hypothetical protein